MSVLSIVCVYRVQVITIASIHDSLFLQAEAKLILEDSAEGETSSVGMSGSVDWNQIDMILKQN